MANFTRGNKPGGIRSTKWDDVTNQAFKHHVVRMGLGTADTSHYPQSAQDNNFGVVQDSGTSGQVTVATDGVVYCKNSLNGTINIGDPVVLDYTNSGGTTGFVRSAVYTENLDAVAPTTHVGDTGTYSMPAQQGLHFPAVPGSIRVIAQVGNGVPATVHPTGTTIVADGTHGFGTSTVMYTIDQPTIGQSYDQAATPREVFRVEIFKSGYKKNNAVN